MGSRRSAQSAEGPAGADLGELGAIAHQDELGPGPGCLVHQRGQVARAHHGRLVHHQHRAGIQAAAEAEEGMDEAGHGGGGDPRPCLELAGRPGGQGHAAHPVARGLPGLAGRVQGVGLPGARPPLHHGHAAPPWVRRSTMCRCSALSVGRRASASRTASGEARPAPASWPARATATSSLSSRWSSGVV